MVGSDQIIIDEVEMGVHIIRNKIGEIFQDVFVREVNRLIYVAVNEHRDGCKMEDLSQLHHRAIAWQHVFLFSAKNRIHKQNTHTHIHRVAYSN